jgi:hypothetical protein
MPTSILRREGGIVYDSTELKFPFWATSPHKKVVHFVLVMLSF